MYSTMCSSICSYPTIYIYIKLSIVFNLGKLEVVYSADVTISFLNDISTNGSIKIVSDNISPLVWGQE
jgi:hypothetical protein